MEKKKKRVGVKFIILGVFLLVLCLTYAFDYIRCTTYKLEVLVSNDQPIASKEEEVEIKVRVTRFGKIMTGHKVFALPTAGTLDKNVAYTDEEGCVYFTYTPYQATKYNPAGDVDITIRDESNSIIWEVNSFTTLKLHLQEEA